MKNRYGRMKMCGHKRNIAGRVVFILIMTFLITLSQETKVWALQSGQNQTVNGVVTDALNNEPLPGVNVIVKGTTIGTSTDQNGEYSLSVPSLNDTLVVSFVGYQTQEIALNGRQTVNISLTSSAVIGEELVVIGYGQQRQSDLTGSISTISANEFENISVDSPDKLLQGKIPGVQLVNNSGQPGSASTIRIRGGASINAGNLPLFVVDGVPFDMSAERSSSGISTGNLGGAPINPLSSISSDDIESISVLKDASATAIYGARGSNGVVLITTKSGQIGGPLVNISTSGGMQEVRKTIPVLNAQQFARIKNEAEVNSGGTPVYSDQEIASFGEGTDWQDEIFRTGSLQEYRLSVSGGNETTQYFVSGGYSQNDGIIIGSEFEEYNVRLNLNTEINDNIRIGNNFTINRTNSDLVRSSTGSSGSGTGVVASALYMNPILPIRNPDGTYVLFNDAGRDFPNPVASAREQVSTVENTRYVNNFFVEVDLLEKIQIKSSIGFNILNNQEVFFKPNNIFLLGTTRNQAERGVLNSEYWVSSNTIKYTTSLGGERNPQTLEVLGGFTVEGESRERMNAGSFDFPSNRLEANDLSAGAEFLTPQSSTESYNLASYLTRINYSFDDRYILTANARVDGSSRFGANNKYGFFPSGAVAWRLSNEEFIRQMNFFENLKLRVSFGKTGNQDIGSFQSLSLLNSTSTFLGEQLAIGFTPANLGNSDLKWESTTQFNLGTDMAIFDGFMSLTADYYNKTTNDLLFNLPLPRSSGYNSILVNLGEIENTGFEFGINANSIPIGEARLNFGFNIATNNNKIVSLGNIEPFFAGEELTRGTGDVILIDEGLSIGTFYGRVFDGMDSNGNVTYRDINGDGEINADDRTVLGEAQPDFTGGITSSLSYKNLELSVNINYAAGNEIFNVNRVELELANGFQNNSTAALDYWTPDNTDTIIPQPTAARGIIFDDRFLEDGSYLRFQDITLAYSLPANMISKLDLNNVRVFVSGKNLITITDYSGYDPEANVFGQANLSQGIDFGVFPTAKTYRAGLEIGF